MVLNRVSVVSSEATQVLEGSLESLAVIQGSMDYQESLADLAVGDIHTEADSALGATQVL